MAGINIAFVADVTSFLSGAGKSQDALEDVGDALDDVAREAQKTGQSAGDDLEKGIKGGADDSTTAVGKLETSFKEMARQASRSSKDAGDDVAKNVKKGTDEGVDATGEFKDEARSNFSEVASSFTGDMDSAADLVQGTFGGLAGSIAGPLGLAFGGLGAAAGVFYNMWKENAEKTKQTVSDMYNDLLESGTEYLTQEAITRRIGELYDTAAESSVKKQRELIRTLAEDSGIDEPLIARAIVGDPAAQEELKSKIAAIRLDLTTQLDEATAKGGNLAPTLAPALEALRDIETEVENTSGALSTAQQDAKAAADAIAGVKANTDGVASSAEDARSKFSGVGQAIRDMPDTKTVRVELDTRDADRWLTLRRSIGVSAFVQQAV